MELTINVEDKEAPFVIELLKKFSFVEFVEDNTTIIKQQLLGEIDELWFAEAQKLFGSKDDFVLWLNSPNISLQHKKPIAVLAQKEGYSLVVKLLGRLAHGIMA